MIYTALSLQLQTIQQLLLTINSNEYHHKNTMLGGSSIGEHVRHVVELIQCLVSGYQSGSINYDNRKRDIKIETDKVFTANLLLQLILLLQQPDITLTLLQNETTAVIQTTYNRELHYNTEHAVHHMALIRVALREMKIDWADENFGVATTTLRYKKTMVCAP